MVTNSDRRTPGNARAVQAEELSRTFLRCAIATILLATAAYDAVALLVAPGQWEHLTAGIPLLLVTAVSWVLLRCAGSPRVFVAC